MNANRFSKQPACRHSENTPWWKRWGKREVTPVAPAQSLPGSPVKSNGRKVLIVDDDAVILKTTGMKLAAQGYTVLTARDASAAIRAARSDQPDLILMDLSFPSDVGSVAWDGFLLMSWLHRLQEARTIPVIVITGDTAVSQKNRAENFGAIAFFPKPIDHVKLVEVINKKLLSSDAEKADFAA
jgi:CheY-like chemotaxis protein